MPSPFFSFAIPGTSWPLSLPLPPHPNPVISTEAVCAFANCVAEKPASLPIQPAQPVVVAAELPNHPNKGRVVVPGRIPILWIKQHHHTRFGYRQVYQRVSDSRQAPLPDSKTILDHSHQHLHLKQHRLTIEAIDRNGVLND